MHVLMTHGWIRGNLGDECITRRCIEGLRARLPELRIDLLTVNDGVWADKRAVAGIVDRFLESPPDTDLTPFLGRYHAVINAPGGGLQNAGDPRGQFMLRDALACAAAGVPHAFASHSFHPSYDLTALRTSFVVAREPASARILAKRGTAHVRSADLAFLEDVPRATGGTRTLVFLRFGHIGQARMEGSVLHLDGRRVELRTPDLALSSSDHARDAKLLTELSREWGAPYVPAGTLADLLRLIAGAAHVVTDRYHPAIFAFMAGVPCTFVQREDSPRDEGLQMLLDTRTPAELAAMADAGLDALAEWLERI